VCVPSCAGKTCGDDGCGGSCGACDAGVAFDAGPLADAGEEPDSGVAEDAGGSADSGTGADGGAITADAGSAVETPDSGSVGTTHAKKACGCGPGDATPTPVLLSLCWTLLRRRRARRQL
jgi:hypothetical protein